MRITWLILAIGGLLGLLCSAALTLFPMRPEEVESQAAAWLSYFGFSEWAEGLTKTTDSWVSATLWTFLAIGIGLVLLALFRMFRRDSNAEAVKRNPGNGWRVSRLIMRVWTLRRVESLCQDFLAQPHKTGEVRVLAARAVRQHRAEGGTEKGSWDFWMGLQAAMEQHGEDSITEAVTALDAEFPPSWPVRCWMKYRRWREKTSKRGDIQPISATTIGKKESESTSSRQTSEADWNEFDFLPLKYAACMWHELPPTEASLRKQIVQEELSRLSLAVKQRKLEHRNGDAYHGALILLGINPANDQFSKQALVRYAKEAGRDLPAFLRSTDRKSSNESGLVAR